MSFKRILKDDGITPSKDYIILQKSIQKQIEKIFDENTDFSPREVTALMHAAVASVGIEKTILAAIKIKKQEKISK